MKNIGLLLIILSLSLQTGCSTTPTVLENSTQLTMEDFQEGTIVNIRQIQLNAEWKKHFAGAILGMATGAAIGSDSLSIAGVFIGGDISNSLYGTEVDEITIEDNQDHKFRSLVTAESFYLQDQVLFKQTDGKLVAVTKR